MNLENEDEEKAKKIIRKYSGMIVDVLNSIEDNEKAILAMAFGLSKDKSGVHCVSVILSSVLAFTSMSMVPQHRRGNFLDVFRLMTNEKIKNMEKDESSQTQH